MTKTVCRPSARWDLSCRTGQSRTIRPRTLRAIVDHYIRSVRPQLEAELNFYARQSGFPQAVELASQATRPDGKRHPHQYRIPGRVLAKTRRPLLALRPLHFKDFDELHTEVERAIRRIDGIGPLMVYDTAVRLGAYLNILPERVYLHAGTRGGAKALGLRHTAKTLEIRDCPGGMRRLAAREIEDCLCIYKSELSEHGAF